MTLSVSSLDQSSTETDITKNESFDFCLPELFQSAGVGSKGASLHVKKLELFEYPEVKNVVEVWKRTALEKAQLSQNLCEVEPFHDCESILFLISCGIQGKDPCFETYVCRDDQGTPQGLMRIQDSGKNSLKIINLVTHPQNIRSPLNGVGYGRVRGAGTSLVKKAEEIAKERKKDVIMLQSLSGSLGFYKKCGFIAEDATFLEMIKLMS